MIIKKVELQNFRNYTKQEIILSNNGNIFYGNNAQGKTNILEAIFLCAFAKSFRTKKEDELIQFQKEKAFVEIQYKKRDREGKISLDITDKKNFSINGVKVKKLSELLGKVNIVMFSPDNIEIIKEGPAKRRKFLDMLISQLKPSYIYNINLYTKTLEQRNIYLRQIKYENKSVEMLEIWNEKLAELGEKIFIERRQIVEKLKNKLLEIHPKVTEEKEKIKIEYKSSCENKEEYLKELKKIEKIDIQRGYTNLGIHRDDFEISINEKPVQVYGSQGQQRTSILSLKLAEVEVIYEEIGEYPILLLDDFMSELDEKRRMKFVSTIKKNQVLITCTDKINIERGKSFYVEEGKIIQETEVT